MTVGGRRLDGRQIENLIDFDVVVAVTVTMAVAVVRLVESQPVELWQKGRIFPKNKMLKVNFYHNSNLRKDVKSD